MDHEAIKQYFPLERVTAGLLDIYQRMLGLLFQHDEQLSQSAWHPDVRAYRVSGAKGCG